MDATSRSAKVSHQHRKVSYFFLFSTLTITSLWFFLSYPFINYRHSAAAAKRMIEESSSSSGSWSIEEYDEESDRRNLTPLYLTVYNVYYNNIKFNKSHKYYNKWEEFVLYCMGLWKNQNMVCNITGGPMDLERGPTMPSLDATVKAVGHVEGNLQFVCHFVNYIQREDCENDTHITAEWYQKYVRRK